MSCVHPVEWVRAGQERERNVRGYGPEETSGHTVQKSAWKGSVQTTAAQMELRLKTHQGSPKLEGPTTRRLKISRSLAHLNGMIRGAKLQQLVFSTDLPIQKFRPITAHTDGHPPMMPPRYSASLATWRMLVWSSSVPVLRKCAYAFTRTALSTASPSLPSCPALPSAAVGPSLPSTISPISANALPRIWGGFSIERRM